MNDDQRRLEQLDRLLAGEPVDDADEWTAFAAELARTRPPRDPAFQDRLEARLFEKEKARMRSNGYARPHVDEVVVPRLPRLLPPRNVTLALTMVVVLVFGVMVAWLMSSGPDPAAPPAIQAATATDTAMPTVPPVTPNNTPLPQIFTPTPISSGPTASPTFLPTVPPLPTSIITQPSFIPATVFFPPPGYFPGEPGTVLVEVNFEDLAADFGYVPIVFAASDIEAGTILRSDMLMVVYWPSEHVVVAYHDVNTVVRSLALTDIPMWSPIRPGQVRNLASVMPGFVTMIVPVDRLDSSADPDAYMVGVGDRLQISASLVLDTTNENCPVESDSGTPLPICPTFAEPVTDGRVEIVLVAEATATTAANIQGATTPSLTLAMTPDEAINLQWALDEQVPLIVSVVQEDSDADTPEIILEPSEVASAVPPDSTAPDFIVMSVPLDRLDISGLPDTFENGVPNHVQIIAWLTVDMTNDGCPLESESGTPLPVCVEFGTASTQETIGVVLVDEASVMPSSDIRGGTTLELALQPEDASNLRWALDEGVSLRVIAVPIEVAEDDIVRGSVVTTLEPGQVAMGVSVNVSRFDVDQTLYEINVGNRLNLSATLYYDPDNDTCSLVNEAGLPLPVCIEIYPPAITPGQPITIEIATDVEIVHVGWFRPGGSSGSDEPVAVMTLALLLDEATNLQWALDEDVQLSMAFVAE